MNKICKKKSISALNSSIFLSKYKFVCICLFNSPLVAAGIV